MKSLSKTETVEVTVKLPEPMHTFYKAVAEHYEKPLETLLLEELSQDILGYLDTDVPKEVLIKIFKLEKFVES
jgi:hypothetical protein